MFCSLIAALAISSASALSVAPNTDALDGPGSQCTVALYESGTAGYYTFAPDATLQNIDTSKSQTTIPLFGNKVGATTSYDVTLQTSIQPGHMRHMSMLVKYHDGTKTASVTVDYDPKPGMFATYSDFDNATKHPEVVQADMSRCNTWNCDKTPISIANGAVEFIRMKNTSDDVDHFLLKTADGVFDFLVETDDAVAENGTTTRDDSHTVVFVNFELSNGHAAPKPGGDAHGICMP